MVSPGGGDAGRRLYHLGDGVELEAIPGVPSVTAYIFVQALNGVFLFLSKVYLSETKR